MNRSGSEYACVQGWGLFDGPVDDASIDAISSWGTNAVRIPLNEHCWLGVNGVSSAYSGAIYRAAITDLVERLHRHGLAAILDLHWAAPGTDRATSQQIAPDADHAPAFWASVAATFKDDPSTMFEVFNEPRDISWACWRDGCRTPAGWMTTGAQQLVDAIRGTGARQPVIVDGLNWGGDLSGWVANAPRDPEHQLVAGWHIYNFSGCNQAACWNDTAAQVAETYPVLLTEVGEDDCAAGFLDQVLTWADEHRIGYLAWSWNTASCGAGPALISSYDGTPTAFGAGYREHLARPWPTAPSEPTAPSASTGQDPASQPADPAALFDFEDGVDGWAARWGDVSVASSTERAATGSGSLLVRVAGGYPAVGTESGLGAVAPGSDVTYRVWAPAGVHAAVSPMVYDQGWQVSVLAAHDLAPGWNTVTFTVPGWLGGVRVLGLQVDAGSDWSGDLALDDVTVTTVRQGFEDGGTSGWSTRWGSLPVWNDGQADTGSHGLGLGVGGSGYPAAGTDQVAGLEPGAEVTLRVWAPDGAAVGVSPMFYDGDWRVTVLPDRQLAAGWNTVRFTVPATVGAIKVLGLQVDDSSGWSGKLVVDSVTW